MISRSRRIKILNPTARKLQIVEVMATLIIRLNENTVGTQPALNFNDSSTVTFQVTNNPVTQAVDVEATAAVGLGIVYSEIAPSTAVEEEIWVNTTTLKQYVKYNDGNSVQWVLVGQTCGSGGGGSGGGSGQVINCGGRTTGVGELIQCGNRV